jgi:hypothetical protein
MSWIKSENNACLLTIKATPRASRNEIAGVQAEWLRVRLQAPPVDGKANAALVDFLAKKLDVSRRAVAIVSGETSRLKSVRIAGLTAEEVCKRLGVS